MQPYFSCTHSQLFGEPDADQDVSPDTEDPELQNEAPETSPEEPLGKRSTRQWAESITYNPREIFSKLFCDDIEYLLTMDKLWQQRTPPTPLHLDHLPQETREEGTLVEMQDQRIWTIGECAEVFVKSIKQLSERYTREGELVWDKDNQSDMDFVSAAANIRSNIFGIPPKNRFDIKSMAGNIIPAIATTNAVIAGVIVIEGLKILSGRLGDCKTTYLPRKPNPRKRLLVSCQLLPPNPKCYVCAEKPEVSVKLNTQTATVRVLQDAVLKGGFGMVAPDVEIDDGKGTIVISSEEDETEENLPHILCDFGIVHGTRLKADDFLQNYQLIVNIVHSSEGLEDGAEFEVVGEAPPHAPEVDREPESIELVQGRKRRAIEEREEREPKRMKENSAGAEDAHNEEDVMFVY
jgi:ubiquitin-like 1-activating enzyme E1 B